MSAVVANNNNSSSEPSASAAQKLWDIMQQRKNMEGMIRYMPAPKPVKEYNNIKWHLEASLKFAASDKEARISAKDHKIGGVDFYQDYDYEDNTVYDTIKKAMDTLEAKCKPLEEAHTAKKEAMLLEIQKLHEEEKTAREDMRKEAADMEAAKRKAKRAKN